MRLSTDPARDEARAIAVIHAALDAGVTLLDTADVYCLDASETGHNERLIARALSAWSGDRSRVVVATKGGLTRPQGRWVPDGRASHLRAACDASRHALGVERIQLYQLHALDPKVPLATSVRALASLKRDGFIEQIGLCNVTVGQIEEARRFADIDAVQVELSIWRDEAVLNGVVEDRVTRGLRLIAHTPLGGPKRAHRTASDAVLREIGARHGATPAEIALACLADLSDAIVPIAGATRVDTARSLARACTIRFTDEDRAALDARFPGSCFDRLRTDVKGSGVETRHVIATREGEVVLVMGLPAAGKTTIARTFVDQGYARLNRDERRGSLRGLMPAFTRLVDSGASRIVLDNTYVSRKARATLVQTAARVGLPVRCVWLSTSLEDAQVNACERMVSKYGRLLGPDEMRRVAKRDVNSFGPVVQFRYQRELEPPDPAEGFSRIEVVPFNRILDASFANRAVLCWWDAALTHEGCAGVLRRYADAGWRLLALAWRPGIADGTTTTDQVDEALARERETLGVPVDVAYCPHGGGPPVCWCRKPLPGLAVSFIQRYHLDTARCIYVGTGPMDPGFARRIGFQYADADVFFGGTDPSVG